MAYDAVSDRLERLQQVKGEAMQEVRELGRVSHDTKTRLRAAHRLYEDALREGFY